MCGGVLGESQCLPCLHGCSNNATLRQDSDDMCMICFTEALSCAPAIQVSTCIYYDWVLLALKVYYSALLLHYSYTG